MSTAVPSGYSLRAASVEDAPEITELVNEVSLAEIGILWTSVEDTRDDLMAPGRSADEDLLLVADDGALAGYVWLWADADPFTEVVQFAYVRPALWGRGLNAWLLRLGEERARGRVHRANAGSPVLLRVARWAANDDARRLFVSLGYMYARTFHEMRMELDRPLPSPEVSDEIAMRAFDPGHDVQAVHATLAEAFADHWGGTFDPFDQWVHQHIEGESAGFDTGLWFVALAGEQVVGAVCCRASTPRSKDTAHVNILGVLPRWRGRGIGRALLLAAFGELRCRGIPAVDLGVDSENQTGATRLYERVGMRTVRRAEWWEKELGSRP
jgi:mycothiol synthase